MSENQARAYQPPVVLGRDSVRIGASEAPGQDASATHCPMCYGTGMEIVPGRGARHCQCRSRSQPEKLMEAARIPPRYRGCALSTYRAEKGNGTQLLAINYAHRLLKEYPAIDRGLLFTGGVGVGKTHLSVAILRALIERGVNSLFCECGALLKEIQESYGPASNASEASLLAPLYRAEVLVLDELGAVKPTEWVRETLGQIIGTRYNDRKLTIFTTNYPDARGASTDETLEDRIGTRLRSRLYEMCRTVLITGEDYRRKFDGQQV